jgi:hypothetical protein
MSESDKTSMLLRLFDGDPHVAAELRSKIRNRMPAETGAALVSARTVGELRARATEIRLDRERAAAEKRDAEQKRRAKEAEKARKARQLAIVQRGEGVWRELEAEIERRNASAYDKAAELLYDLQAIAKERGAIKDFRIRLHALREHHVRKVQFIKRLEALG